ncbi:hypothetical protein Smp_151330 [Schistosoma mansoni]|nr:hypothetical protein Smp_151330 [Schistosoma mansoni]|eukprot:XP_018647225.1 hypothetical protein Smp_151330 [Schistosoma mansoni]
MEKIGDYIIGTMYLMDLRPTHSVYFISYKISYEKEAKVKLIINDSKLEPKHHHHH